MICVVEPNEGKVRAVTEDELRRLRPDEQPFPGWGDCAA
jgi:hypothetical protein